MNFASLKEWWALAIPLIDIRENQEGIEVLALSKDDSKRMVVHLPFVSVVSGERSCELPPRHIAFGILVADGQDVQELQDFFFATISKATQQSRKPWQVSVVLIASQDLWVQAKELGIHHEITQPDGGLPFFKPLPRLWQPDPLLPSILWPILERSLPSIADDCEVWDLGSGAGRDACYLAERIKTLQLMNKKCTVVGIDNHKASAKRCEPFWRNRKVEEVTKSLNLNLNKIDLVEHELQGCTVLCFYAVRFWNRKLVTYLAQDNGTVKAGTLFAMSHFCKPYPGAPWDFDHPKVRTFDNIDDARAVLANSTLMCCSCHL
jgi:SAM-dependent methyltransferase